MKTKSYLLAALFAILILLPNTAKSAAPPDSYGHEKVVLRGGLINYWNTNIPFEYLGNDVWSLQTTLVPTPDQNNSYQDIEIRVDGRDWKTGSSTFAVSTDITYTTNGNDIKITSADQGEYVITVKFTAEDKATVRFDPPGSAPTTPTVTTKAYYVLDDTPTETALGGGTINISSGNAAKSLYFMVETTEDETVTATSYYSASGTWNSLTTLTKSDNQPTGITLPASQYVYTVTYGDLTDTPDNPTITITENVPLFEAIYLNDQPFVDGGDYTFASGDVLNFQAKMTDGSFVNFKNASSEELHSRSYTLTTTGTGSITAPNTASRYIYTLSIDRVSDTQWRLIVDSRTFVTAVKINGADYADGTFSFTNGQAITFTAEMSDGSTKTYKPSSATTLASGTYTLTPSGSGSITAPTDAEDYVYTLSLNHSDDNSWILSVISRSQEEMAGFGTLSSTLPYNLKYYGVNGGSFTPDNDLTMWYTNGEGMASSGNNKKLLGNSLLIGNGALGAMLEINNATHKLYISEKELFKASANDHSLESFATLEITPVVWGSDANTNIISQLDLTKGVYSFIGKRQDNIVEGFEWIASYPDQVLAGHISASEGQKLSYQFYLGSYNTLGASVTNTISGNHSVSTFSGKLYGSILSYALNMRVVPKGGTISIDDGKVKVMDADAIDVYISGLTDYDSSVSTLLSGTANLASQVASNVEAAATKGWQGVYNTHTADHGALFNSMSLNIEGQKNEISTQQLLSNYSTTSSASKRMLENLVFSLGRYMEIASSRPRVNGKGVDCPSNLQGIWNDGYAQWKGDIHGNINVNMNYWPSEVTNLSETHLGLCNWVMNLSKYDLWQNRAKAYTKGGGSESITQGWTCYMASSPFGSGYNFPTQNNNAVQAWYCHHLIQHYLFTRDESYRQQMMPVLWDAARFWMQYLIKTTSGSSYIYETQAEDSPEQGQTGIGTPHTQQLVYYLFENLVKLTQKFGKPSGATDDEWTKIQDIFTHLDNGLHSYNQDGNLCLREDKTKDDGRFGEKNHRHLSHLMCVYPLAQVHPGDDMFDVAKNTMIDRGAVGYGSTDLAVWTLAWKAANWAQARDHKAFQNFVYSFTEANGNNGGLYNNLYSNNQTTQIDGNFGLTGAVAEMLMQSNRSDVLCTNPYAYIDIAPALPVAEWTGGEVKGLKAQGNFEVDYKWHNGQVTEIKITAKTASPIPFYVHYGEPTGGTYALTDASYHVSAISGMTRDKDETIAKWDADHVWKFVPTALGSYVVITLGAGEDVQPDPDPEPEYDAVLYGPTAPVPNTVGIQTVMQGSTPLMRVMFGTKEAMYYDSSSKTFMDGGVTWTKQGSEALDGSISIDALEGYAAGSAYQSDKSALPFTEVNGQMAAQNTKNGGMFLTPISGDFLRLEPLYTGTATLWLRQTGSLYVMDEDGKVIDVATKSSNVSAQATDGGYSVTGDNQKVKYTIAVKGGKTYYVGTRDHALGFTAAAFAKADYTAADYYLDSDADVSSQTWPATGATVNYTVHREFTAGYCHPIVLPFSVSESKFLDVFGEGAVAVYLDPYPNSSKDDDRTYMSAFMPAIGNNTLYFTVHYYQMLYANVPAFVIPARLVTDPTFHDVTYAGNVIRDYTLDANGNFTVTGSYTSTTAADNKEMYFINNTGGSSNTVRVYHSAEGVDMKPLRAWISARSTTTQAPPRINGVGFHSFPDGDDVAYIADIVSDDLPTVADDRVYNLLGIPVAIGTTEGLAPGIYIHRGAKVLVR